LVDAIEDGTWAFDLRLDPKPRPLKRLFKELIRAGRCGQWKAGGEKMNAVELRYASSVSIQLPLLS
jgi:hypothetical protein